MFRSTEQTAAKILPNRLCYITLSLQKSDEWSLRCSQRMKFSEENVSHIKTSYRIELNFEMNRIVFAGVVQIISVGFFSSSENKLGTVLQNTGNCATSLCNYLIFEICFVISLFELPPYGICISICTFTELLFKNLTFLSVTVILGKI